MEGLSADEVIRLLDLRPHPEGGMFRETFRDGPSPQGRAYSTAIYFLLREGEASRWHRVDAVETWHWYAGAALDLEIFQEAGERKAISLGPDLSNGERPQAFVPAMHWQRAASKGAWTLVGCTVAPGFEFSGFFLAPEGQEPSDL